MPSTERRSRAANFRTPRTRHQHKRPNARPAVSTSSPSAGSELDAKLDAAAQLDPETLPKGFAGLGLPEKLVTVLNRRGIDAPFAIQARTLPDALAGRDVLGRAQTGSGKTLAFGLPMLTRLAAEEGRRLPGKPRGLVLVPTRELAQQVTDALAPLGHALGLKTTAVYGGASMSRQISALRNARRHRRRHAGPPDRPDRAARVRPRPDQHRRSRRGRLHGRPRLHAGRHPHPRPHAGRRAATAVLRHAGPRRRQARAPLPGRPGLPRGRSGCRADRVDGAPGVHAAHRGQGRRRGGDRRAPGPDAVSSSAPSTAPTGSPSSSSGSASTLPRSTATSPRAPGAARSSRSRTARRAS